MSESKGQFNSNFGFIMASVSSAVGLGNIWEFPRSEEHTSELQSQ